jgi:DNA-binding response OmpR family regulator
VQQRPRVLVVEDDADTLEAVATTLREEFAVWVARTGEQALEVADELGFDADVVVIDLDLGRGMTGERFASEYRRRAKRPARMVVLSGVRAAHEIARGMRAAAALPKPYDADELVRTIRILAPRRLVEDDMLFQYVCRAAAHLGTTERPKASATSSPMTMHQGKRAYCTWGASAGHDWQAVDPVSLADLRRVGLATTI